MQTSDIIGTLRESTLFSSLNDQELEAIAFRTKIRQYFPNDVIVWQGQPSKTLYFIMNGIVAVKNSVRGKENILAYLITGNTFGEVGILENQPRSASVVAVSEVDVLVVQREDFLDILHQHASVAVELARLLGHYLVQSNRRLANEHKDRQMILILNAQDRTGSTTLGTLLAKKLFDTRKNATAYLEYPNPRRLLQGDDSIHDRSVFNHVDGYDILFPVRDPNLPFATQTTLLLDKIKHQYSNIVVNIHGKLDEAIYGMIDDASQILLLSRATPTGIKDAQYLLKELKKVVQAEETAIFTVLTEMQGVPLPPKEDEQADFVIPHLDNYPTFRLRRSNETIPEVIDDMVKTSIDRLERTNSLGVYIPTTINGNQAFDTQEQMQRTMNFMAELFGGATCKVGSGVWNSDRWGLVGESVFIIHSYITQPDLNRYLDDVLDFIRELKKELKQEAMALEINRKLTLI